jgi:ankyrin repeat protein
MLYLIHAYSVFYFFCSGHYETTQMLLEAKCDATLTTIPGATALHLAAGSGNHELCELMTSLEHADVSVEDDNGQTAIDMALSSGYKELASKLACWSMIASRTKAILAASSHVMTI